MLTCLETHKVDPDFRWLELVAEDSANQGSEIVRVVVNDHHRMYHAFLERYFAKREHKFEVPSSQAVLIEDFFQEACMARLMVQNKSGSPDINELLPTTVICFTDPERTSFRKTRVARVRLFLDEAAAALRTRDFAKAMHRLGWAHDLEPENEEAFELKIVCLRNWDKLPETIPVFEAWRDAHPEEVAPRLGLGEMWLHLDQNQRAHDTFEALLAVVPHQAHALMGLAQAKVKLGEDPLPELRKAYVVDALLTRDMIEHDFDFRGKHPEDLEAMSLKQISEEYQIPLPRVLARARDGVLPVHAPEEDGLLCFKRRELDLHYRILLALALEIAGRHQA